MHYPSPPAGHPCEEAQAVVAAQPEAQGAAGRGARVKLIPVAAILFDQLIVGRRPLGGFGQRSPKKSVPLGVVFSTSLSPFFTVILLVVPPPFFWRPFDHNHPRKVIYQSFPRR